MQALGLGYASDAVLDRLLDATGGRANLIAICCHEMLRGLSQTQRKLGDADLEQALGSRSMRSALEGWGNLTSDEAAARLDRIIVYGLIERDRFALADVLDLLRDHAIDHTPDQVKESLTRLELAFLIGRDGSGYGWQVPLWRDMVLAEEPARMLEQELRSYIG